MLEGIAIACNQQVVIARIASATVDRSVRHEGTTPEGFLSPTQATVRYRMFRNAQSSIGNLFPMLYCKASRSGSLAEDQSVKNETVPEPYLWPKRPTVLSNHVNIYIYLSLYNIYIYIYIYDRET